MRNLTFVPFLLAAASFLISCEPNTAVSHGHNTALDSVDLVEMTQKMTDAILSNPSVQADVAQKGRLKVVIEPVENKMVGEILPRGAKEAFIARLRAQLQERAPEKFIWIINRDAWHALRNREIDAGPDPMGLQPEYALTATFSSITDETSNRRSSYYLCVYHLTNIQSRQLVWTDKFEVKKTAVKEFLD
jgi:PBP1b-binding outer membrane lipoprotein LpoB